MTGLIRFGLKRNTPGKWLRSSRPIGLSLFPEDRRAGALSDASIIQATKAENQ